MEIDKLIKKPNLPIKLQRLYYLSFIKFISMLAIIKWHISIWKMKPIDYGARMCEFLFASSGFLVGYNHFRNPLEANYYQSFSYIYKHLKSFYPMYLINTFIDMYIHRNIPINFLTFVEILIINILMLQSWSRYKEFVPCFNGHTWFLSSLLFCYFLSPILLRGIKSIKRSLIIFLITALIRILEEEIIIKGAINLFDADFHYGPIVRLLEFYMGMLTVPLYFFIKIYLDTYKGNRTNLKLFFTFIQIFVPIIIYIIMFKYNYIIYRCHFALIFSIFIPILGLDYGYFSNIFASKLFQIIMNCQIEMYLLQLNMNYYINKLLINKHSTNILHIEFEFAFKIITIFMIGFFYKQLLKEKLTNVFNKIILFIFDKI